MSRLKTFEQTEWALKPDAQEALKALEAQGWDRDLALATLEATLGAESLYDLSEDEEEQ